ncbi:MAG: NrfD/PsrC family molybdoenzyme membrane anchor subunit [Syntrophobacteraceae bacterium]
MTANKKIGWGRTILYSLLGLGGVCLLARLILGLGATTNLNDSYPWGLWISLDVLTGVALASGGYVMTLIIYVFNLERYRPLLRPAKLSAFVGYIIFMFGLFVDLGTPWRIWHPLIMWNPQSVLFEVSWCVMLYTTVLGLDVFIFALEKLRAETWVRFFRNIYIVMIVAGVVLSTLHQSSLGALYLLIPEKMSDLWATRAISILFLVSAIVGGLAVITLESLASSRAHGAKPEIGILSGLARGMGAIMLVYFAMKAADVVIRGVDVLRFDGAHLLFSLEMLIALLLSVVLLTSEKLRTSVTGLMCSASAAIFWVALTRFNVSLTAYAGYRDKTYFPSLIEIIITVSLVALGILVLDLAARYLPIYEPHEPAGAVLRKPAMG